MWLNWPERSRLTIFPYPILARRNSKRKNACFDHFSHGGENYNQNYNRQKAACKSPPSCSIISHCLISFPFEVNTDLWTARFNPLNLRRKPVSLLHRMTSVHDKFRNQPISYLSFSCGKLSFIAFTHFTRCDVWSENFCTTENLERG